MCNGFGMIISKEIKGFFTMPDMGGNMSHGDIIKALGWKENTDARLRHFIRVECPDWTMKTFVFDEDSTLPAWAEENKDEIISLVKKTLSKCAPAWAEYQKVRAPARAEYEKVRDAARAEYEKVRDAAWAEYEKVRDAAWAEYEKVRDAAWKRLHTRLSKISGFVS